VDDFLTEQQQAEQVKGWLRQNGLFLIGGVVIGLGALFGWNQWNLYQQRQAEAASAAYDVFLVAVRGGLLTEAEAGMNTLASGYKSSPYTDQARLAMARLYLDQSKPDQAVDSLRQVVTTAASPEFANIARLRLARVLVFQEKFDEALKNLPDPDSKAFAPAFHDVRGDVYYAMGKFAEARSEYEQALNGELSATAIDKNYVQAKLDDLGGATAITALSASSGALTPPAASTPATSAPAP
jgi:predicted negative regulator of RcsB-dependent stress response